jgi:hypothetical protein
MPVTDSNKDKPTIAAITTSAPLRAAAPAAQAGAEPASVATEVPWFFQAGVTPEGAKARLAAVTALREAVTPLATALQAAVGAGAATPAEAAQLGLLTAWSRRLEVEAALLTRAVADLGQRAP